MMGAAGLLDMAAYPGEHYPVEVDVTVGVYDEDGWTPPDITGEERQLRCGCTVDLRYDWPHR